MIAVSYHLMGVSCYWQGKAAEAKQWLRQSLELSRRRLDLVGLAQSERQQLMLFRAPKHRLNDYLSLVLQTDESPAAAYDDVLAWKGSVFRQQQQLHVAADDPQCVAVMSQLRSTASRLAALAFMTPPRDQRDAWLAQLEQLAAEREQLETQLAGTAPVARQSRQAVKADQVADALPADTVLVDFVEFAFSPLPAAGQAETPRLEWRLAAFVVRRGRPVALLDLGAAEPVSSTVDRWPRRCRQGRSGDEAAADLQRLVLAPAPAACGRCHHRVDLTGWRVRPVPLCSSAGPRARQLPNRRRLAGRGADRVGTAPLAGG